MKWNYAKCFTVIEIPKRDKMRKLKTQRKQTLILDLVWVEPGFKSQMPVTGTETGGEGGRAQTSKIDIARGHNIS